MRFRDRQNELGELGLRNTGPADASTGSAPAPGNLNAIRQAGEALLDAGDDAIDRALSGNSEEFLAASRQQGGQ
jgi:hypothetical protein